MNFFLTHSKQNLELGTASLTNFKVQYEWQTATLFAPGFTMFGCLVAILLLRGEFIADQYQRYKDSREKKIDEKIASEEDPDFLENSFVHLKGNAIFFAIFFYDFFFLVFSTAFATFHCWNIIFIHSRSQLLWIFFL